MNPKLSPVAIMVPELRLLHVWCLANFFDAVWLLTFDFWPHSGRVLRSRRIPLTVFDPFQDYSSSEWGPPSQLVHFWVAILPPGIEKPFILVYPHEIDLLALNSFSLYQNKAFTKQVRGWKAWEISLLGRQSHVTTSSNLRVYVGHAQAFTTSSIWLLAVAKCPGRYSYMHWHQVCMHQAHISMSPHADSFSFSYRPLIIPSSQEESAWEQE